MTVTDQPVEMDHVSASQVRGNPDKYRLGAGHKTLPVDLPCFMHVTRHMRETDDGAKGLIGHTLDVEGYGEGRAVQIKFVKGGPMVVYLNGVELARTST